MDWNRNWNVWKAGQFTTLQTESMESATQELFKRLQKLQRELKVCPAAAPLMMMMTMVSSVFKATSGLCLRQDKQWEIIDFCKTKIDQFRRILPLIVNLKNPAMRDR